MQPFGVWGFTSSPNPGAKGRDLWNHQISSLRYLATSVRLDDTGGMNVFTTDHPLASQPFWFDAKAHPVLSYFSGVFLLALLLSPLILFGLYEYAMTDIGADNPFPEPGSALLMGSILAFVLGLFCACPLVLAYRLVARIWQRRQTVASQ